MIPGTYSVAIALRFPEQKMDTATDGTVTVDEDGATYQEIVDGLVTGCSKSAREKSAKNGIIIPETSVPSIIFLQIELVQPSTQAPHDHH